MFINVEGGTKTQRKHVESMAIFAAYKLMGKLADRIELDIELSPRLYKEDHNIGDVIYEDSNHKPRQFTMRVDNTVKMRRILETVAHEMVHAKQFAKGELVELVKSQATRWHGKSIKKIPEYWERPWEIEAHGRETGLFLKWVEDQGLEKESWTWDDLDKYKQAYEQ